MFPEEISYMPLPMDVKFYIDLVQGATSISKAPNKMAPAELRNTKPWKFIYLIYVSFISLLAFGPTYNCVAPMDGRALGSHLTWQRYCDGISVKIMCKSVVNQGTMRTLYSSSAGECNNLECGLKGLNRVFYVTKGAPSFSGAYS